MENYRKYFGQRSGKNHWLCCYYLVHRSWQEKYGKQSEFPLSCRRYEIVRQYITWSRISSPVEVARGTLDAPSRDEDCARHVTSSPLVAIHFSCETLDE